MITKYRLITQTAILFGIILITFFNHYENQKVKYGGDQLIQKSIVLRSIDKVVGKLENRSKIMRYLQGDVWAAQINKIKIVDPLAFLGNLARTKKVYGVLFFAALIPAILTLALGKVFCSWICPMGLFFEINDKLRQFLIKQGVPLFKVTMPHWVKYIVLGAGLIMGLLFGFHFFFIIYPPKLVSGEIYFLVTRSAFSFGIQIIFCYLAIELLFAPRVWCQSLCPGGALYTLLSKVRLLRIKNDLKNCTDCGICDEICPYKINPSKGHLSAECDHCSICIDKCPVKTLSFIVGKDRGAIVKMPIEKKNIFQKSQSVRHIFLLLIIFMCGFLMSANAYAHHIRGLPHHDYSTNYPQTPTYEEFRNVDDLEINFSFIKIFETKNCDLAIYIKNKKTGKPYQGTVNFRVYSVKENFHDVHSVDALLDPTNTFRAGWEYEKDGTYILRIKFKHEQKEYIEEFRMQLGEGGFDLTWTIVPGFVILFLVLLVVFKRKKTSPQDLNAVKN